LLHEVARNVCGRPSEIVQTAIDDDRGGSSARPYESLATSANAGEDVGGGNRGLPVDARRNDRNGETDEHVFPCEVPHHATLQ
jgi:hypothetical protein